VGGGLCVSEGEMGDGRVFVVVSLCVRDWRGE
jgi:hypothetical protein